jgi:hypothetical protein
MISSGFNKCRLIVNIVIMIYKLLKNQLFTFYLKMKNKRMSQKDALFFLAAFEPIPRPFPLLFKGRVGDGFRKHKEIRI